MKPETTNSRHSREIRSTAQQIRRNMITRVKPSGKMYSRKKLKSTEGE
jgi:hypothetical protein